jgi:hypothetical protein
MDCVTDNDLQQMAWKTCIYPLPKRDVGVAVLLAFDRITEWVRWVSAKSGDQHQRHISIITYM